ncbi:hypothetical protein MSAN_01384900 [Mycena sanguinolenta]|uniref:Uncharacterized protein n=1 Tax=Mycena sanguinolenta TaxID=230812 RepID=A0A8H6YA99_9AGAR|nr:hypothetical protein MSAN_01384900 [Mycena sanguinolenta]
MCTPRTSTGTVILAPITPIQRRLNVAKAILFECQTAAARNRNSMEVAVCPNRTLTPRTCCKASQSLTAATICIFEFSPYIRYLKDNVFTLKDEGRENITQADLDRKYTTVGKPMRCLNNNAQSFPRFNAMSHICEALAPSVPAKRYRDTSNAFATAGSKNARGVKGLGSSVVLAICSKLEPDVLWLIYPEDSS